MILLSFNIRGLGGVLKRKKIKELVRNYKVDFFGYSRNKNGDGVRVAVP
jgi:hypothetical protein